MVEIIFGTLPNGYGYGDGYGYGSGSGSGSGDGYGYGYGDGYGYGSGSGDGYGYGYGDGYGYGYGYGSGYGDGDGYGPYWLACLPYFVAKMSEAARSRYATLAAQGIKFAYWRSGNDGRAANGGSGVTAKVGAIHKETGPLNLCCAGTLHATLLPTKWKGARWWIVAMHGEVVGDDEKFGCLEREIIGECI